MPKGKHTTPNEAGRMDQTGPNGGIPIEKAVSAWLGRREAGFRLQNERRSAILRATLSGGEKPAGSSLFPVFPMFSRLAVAAILPLALLVLLAPLAALLLPFDSVQRYLPGREAVATAGHATIGVKKDGEQILFTIANGGTVHTISKSADPRHFEPGRSVRVTGGTYRDRMVESSDLVFYKID